MGRWERHCKHCSPSAELELEFRNLVSAAPKQWLFEVIDEDGSNGNLKSTLLSLNMVRWDIQRRNQIKNNVDANYRSKYQSWRRVLSLHGEGKSRSQSMLERLEISQYKSHVSRPTKFNLAR